MSEFRGIFPLKIGGTKDCLREKISFLRPIVHNLTRERSILNIRHPRFWRKSSVLVEVFGGIEGPKNGLSLQRSEIEAEYERRGLKFPEDYHSMYFCEQHQDMPPDDEEIVFYRGPNYDHVSSISRFKGSRHIYWCYLYVCSDEFPELGYEAHLPRTSWFAGIRE